MSGARLLRICIWVLGTLLMSSLPVFAQAPVPKALREAKTVYLINEGASESMFDGLAKDLQKWGRWELVDEASRADLTITIGGLKAFKGWPMTIRSTDGTPVWSDRQKRGITTSVTEAMVKKLRERLERSERS
jgi:hypothetical protein